MLAAGGIVRHRSGGGYPGRPDDHDSHRSGMGGTPRDPFDDAPRRTRRSNGSDRSAWLPQHAVGLPAPLGLATRTRLYDPRGRTRAWSQPGSFWGEALPRDDPIASGLGPRPGPPFRSCRRGRLGTSPVPARWPRRVQPGAASRRRSSGTVDEMQRLHLAGRDRHRAASLRRRGRLRTPLVPRRLRGSSTAGGMSRSAGRRPGVALAFVVRRFAMLAARRWRAGAPLPNGAWS